MSISSLKEFERLVEAGAIPESALEEMIQKWNPIIPVDPNSMLIFSGLDYPGYMKKLRDPELSSVGPAELDARKFNFCLHPDQKKGATGNMIYFYLKESRILDWCCNLIDLKAIQAKGVDFFLNYFSLEIPYAWGSVIESYDGDFFVPCLSALGNSPNKSQIGWKWLGNRWDANEVALVRSGFPLLVSI